MIAHASHYISSLALAAQGHRYISNECSKLRTNIFSGRLMLQRTNFMLRGCALPSIPREPRGGRIRHRHGYGGNRSACQPNGRKDEPAMPRRKLPCPKQAESWICRLSEMPPAKTNQVGLLKSPLAMQRRRPFL